MSTQSTIFALFAVSVALIWSGWDFVCDEWAALTIGKKILIGSCAILLLGTAFIRGVVPVVWQY